MNEEQLQELLSVYRFRRPMPALPRRSNPYRWLAVAAAVIVIVVVVAIWPKKDANWRTDGRVLRAGETIATPARLESRAVGVVDVAENTIVRVEGGNRLSLERGTTHAKTTSPPGIFVVDTPRARAIDLGCEYVLSIAENGGGILRVTLGWVALNNWAQTLVPQGAKASIDAGGHLGPPIFEDASPEFQSALSRGDLEAALPLARRRDALTLLNLFRSATPDQRLLLYDRLNQLVPAPPSVPREAMRNWTMLTTEPWWPSVLKASGVPAIKKKKRVG